MAAPIRQMSMPMMASVSKRLHKGFYINTVKPLFQTNAMQTTVQSHVLRIQRFNYGKYTANKSVGGLFKSSNLKFRMALGISVAGFGLGITAAYGLKKFYGDQTNVLAQTSLISNMKISRQINHPADNTGLKLTLFQYQTCPFCCKVRAYLDYHGFSYNVVEVNSVLRSQIKWSSYKKVPILVHEKDESGDLMQLNDSSVIISALETYLVDPTQSLEKILTFYPSLESKNEKGKKVIEFPNKYFVMYGDAKLSSTEEDRKLERKWRRWVESVLVHTLSPNIYRSPSESLQSFKYFAEVGNWKENFSAPMCAFIVYVGASAMYFVGKMLKRRHNLDDDVRKSLYEAVKEWDKAVGKSKRFLGGDSPNLADLSVYGVLSSIEGCEAFQDLLTNTNIKRWYYTTKEEITKSAGGPPFSKKH